MEEKEYKKKSGALSNALENLIIAIIVVAVFIVGNSIVHRVAGRSSEETLRLFVKSIQEMDVDTLVDDLYQSDYYETLLEEEGMSEAEYKNSVVTLYQGVRSQASEIIGKELAKGNFSLAYEVEDSIYFTSEEIDDFNKELERMGYRGKTVEDAVSVLIKMTVADIDSGGSSTTYLFSESYYVTLIKIGNRWYMTEIG